jgi:hypothetical protein
MHMQLYCHGWAGMGCCTTRSCILGTQNFGRVTRRPGRRSTWVSCSDALHRSSGRDKALQALNSVLTSLRKNDLPALQRLLESGEDAAAASSADRGKGSGLLQRYGYREGGVLAEFSDVFDLSSRRLLPSNLLRRSQVLSTIRYQQGHGQSGYLVRMNVTSKSGEEGTVMWRLSATNCVVTCVGSNDSSENGITVVHPRHSPDAVLNAYMRAMTEKNFVGAQEFCAWNPGLYDGLDLSSLGGRCDPAYRDALDGFFSNTMSAAPYHTLANSDEWLLADGVLLDQNRMVREVVVRVGPGAWAHWGVELAIGGNGCWAVDGIRFLE